MSLRVISSRGDQTDHHPHHLPRELGSLQQQLLLRLQSQPGLAGEQVVLWEPGRSPGHHPHSRGAGTVDGLLNRFCVSWSLVEWISCWRRCCNSFRKVYTNGFISEIQIYTLKCAFHAYLNPFVPIEESFYETLLNHVVVDRYLGAVVIHVFLIVSEAPTGS